MTLFLVPCVFLLVGRYSSPRSTIAEKLNAMQERYGPNGIAHEHGSSVKDVRAPAE
jgi:hypothetical protein